LFVFNDDLSSVRVAGGFFSTKGFGLLSCGKIFGQRKQKKKNSKKIFRKIIP